jgi:polysaccharide biosynthesis protein PslG
MMKNTAASLLVLLPWTLTAAPDFPPLEIPEGVGVNIHFTRGHERDLDLIATAGFKFIRMDFSWGGTERRKGEYNWGDYEELTGNLEKRGLRAIYILDYSNGLYEDTIVSRDPISGKETRSIAAPRKPESREAFARWSAAAAAQFKGRRVVWEIWNEPNIGFWRPEPKVEDYTQLVLATSKAVRTLDPDATIIGPASSGFPWAFFESMFKDGTLESLDAISVHPYRGYSQGPETAAKDYLRLSALAARHAPKGRKPLPIISGEWGYATHGKGGVTLETQAAFVARQQLANLHAGIPISIWYDWKNDGIDPNEGEHNFGTVSNNLAFKPAYTAVKTLTRQLAGFRVARRLDAGHDDAWVLLCVDTNGNQKIAAWSTGQPREAVLDLKGLSPGDVSAVDVSGQPVTLQVEADRLRLALQAGPQYITFRKQRSEFMAAAAWELGPVVSLVEAGRTNAIAVPIKLRNPFDKALSADLHFDGQPGFPSLAVVLKPGQSAERILEASTDQRWPEILPTTLHVKISTQDAAGTQTEVWRGRAGLDFTIANPIELQLGPVERGLRLRVASHAGSPFTGKVRLDGRERTVQLTPDRPDTTIEWEGAGGAVSVLDAKGQTVASMPEQKFHPVALEKARAALDGDRQVPAQTSLTSTNAPPGLERPFSRAWRLDYQFDAGWRFVRAVVDSPKTPAFAQKPHALGLWVYSDGSGNSLRMRVADTEGQTFQPSGPDLTWTGWRWVTFDLADLKNAGHWGGANDGVSRGALRLDTLLLVDGSRKKTAGTIYFAGPTLLTDYTQSQK